MHMEQTTNSISSPTFTGTAAPSAGPASPKQQFLDVFKRESATTRRVLKALPDSATELRPHPTSQCAREVASIFSLGQGLAAAALTNNWQWPPQFPAAPATYAEVLANFEATNHAVLQALANTPDPRLLSPLRAGSYRVPLPWGAARYRRSTDRRGASRGCEFR